MANLNKLKKYHFLYKTTNLLNGKFYIGIHSTNNLNDGYLGSGKRLKRSIKKYGIENFKLEILEFFENRELLVEREKELVNAALLKEPLCMNLKTGGTGGNVGIDGKVFGGDRWIGAKKYWSLPENKEKLRKLMIKNLQKSRENGTNHIPSFKGKTHTEETKQKMSEAKKGKGIGKCNTQFGTVWITNGTENKKIKKEERIPVGWKAGRVLHMG
jgi:group I intron endonuclease